MILQVHNLTVRSGEQTLLTGVSMALDRGEALGITGPPGAGKSALLRAVAGLLRPTAGSVEVGVGRERIAYLAQEPDLYPDLNAEQHLAFYGGLFGLSDQALRRRSGYLLERTGLGPHKAKPVRTLRPSFRQMVALAATLVRPADILLMDEPFAPLSEGMRLGVWELIREMTKSGTTLLLAGRERYEILPTVRLENGRLRDEPQRVVGE